MTSSQAPMIKVAADLKEVSRGVSGGRYILMVVDSYSGFAITYSLKNKKVCEVANHLQDAFLKYGTPSHLLTDNGKEFKGAVSELCRTLGIKKKLTNGEVEAYNKILMDFIRHELINKEIDMEEWESVLSEATSKMNTRPLRTVQGFTPFYHFMGRPFKAPDDISDDL